jgi:hypothetical protein
MQCANCGRPLQPNEALCPNCGEPVANEDWRTAAPDTTPTWLPRQAERAEPTVDSNAPTLYGLPIGPDRYGPTAAPPLYGPAAPPRRGAAPSRARRVPLTAALCALGLLGALFVGALVASGQGFPGFGFGPSAAPPTATAGPSPTPTPACPLPAVDPQTARMLKSVQLATGVRNAARHPPDLRPIDNVKAFTVGQSPYVTFQIATSQAGTVRASFCFNGTSIGGNPLDIPRGYLNARGEFHLPALTADNVGPGAVVLTWNDAVAAALPFTVRSQ